MTSTAHPRPSHDPFNAPTTQEGVVASAEHLRQATTQKPWGHEVLFADGSHGYVGKLLHVRADCSLSLQLHRRKDETISVLSGEIVFLSGSTADHLIATTMITGDTVHVPATVIHRITAVSGGAVLVEVSTAEAGWAHDIERLADDHGREFTREP
jgi:quercetin dioxygenase-like cupin family protein